MNWINVKDRLPDKYYELSTHVLQLSKNLSRLKK